MFNGGGGGLLGGLFGGTGGPQVSNRTFMMFGWMLTILAIASLVLAVANTTYTYITYDGDCEQPAPIIGSSLCPEHFVYISSGIWASIPIFLVGIMALRLFALQGLRQIFMILVFLSALLFAPAMIIINILEIIVGTEDIWYTLDDTGINGDAVKFALPLIIAVLGFAEMIILLLMLMYLLRNPSLAAAAGSPLDPYADPYGDPYGGDPYGDPYGGDPYGGYGYDDGFLGGDPFSDPFLDDIAWEDPFVDDGYVDDGYYDPGYYDPGYGGGVMPMPMGSGGGGGGGGGSAAASSGGSGGASNNNNNNIVIPPVIFPPQQQAPAHQNPAPTPIFLPVPQAHHRPALKPLPPTRYYPHHRGPGHMSASYMSGAPSPFPFSGGRF